MINKRQKVSIENTRFIFTTNFSGDPSRDRFGSNKRRVNLVLTEDMAHHLMDMGVTVKQTRPNPEKTYDEPFLPTYFVPVNTPYKDLWYYHLKSRAGIDLAISRALNSKKAFNERKFYGA